jgi:myosin heavy subunit
VTETNICETSPVRSQLESPVLKSPVRYYDPFSDNDSQVQNLLRENSSLRRELNGLKLERAEEKVDVADKANEESKRGTISTSSLKDKLLELYENLDESNIDQIRIRLEECLKLDNGNVSPQIEGYPTAVGQLSRATVGQDLIAQLENPAKTIQHPNEQVTNLEKELELKRSENTDLIDRISLWKYSYETVRSQRDDLQFVRAYESRELSIYRAGTRRRRNLLRSLTAIQGSKIDAYTDHADDEFYDLDGDPFVLPNPSAVRRFRSNRCLLKTCALVVLSTIRLRNRYLTSMDKKRELREKFEKKI